MAAADASAWWNTKPEPPPQAHLRQLRAAREPPRLPGAGRPQQLADRLRQDPQRRLRPALRRLDHSTVLDYEIEKWDESGNSYVWVRVPQIDLSSSTDFIWMYYGNAGAANVQNAAAVWAGYSVVHHLDETSGPHLDSTSNGNNSSVIDVQTQASPLGIIDGADVFSAASTDNVDVPDSASLDMAAGDFFLVEAWINTVNAGDQMVVDKESQGDSGRRRDPALDERRERELLAERRGRQRQGQQRNRGGQRRVALPGRSLERGGEHGRGLRGRRECRLGQQRPGSDSDHGNAARDRPGRRRQPRVRLRRPHRRGAGGQGLPHGQLDQGPEQVDARNAFVNFGPEVTPVNYRSIGTVATIHGHGQCDVWGQTNVTGTGTAWSMRMWPRRPPHHPLPQPAHLHRGVHYTVHAVASDASLFLTTPFTGAQPALYTYMLARQLATFAAWEDCVDGPPGHLPLLSRDQREPRRRRPPRDRDRLQGQRLHAGRPGPLRGLDDRHLAHHHAHGRRRQSPQRCSGSGRRHRRVGAEQGVPDRRQQLHGRVAGVSGTSTASYAASIGPRPGRRRRRTCCCRTC